MIRTSLKESSDHIDLVVNNLPIMFIIKKEKQSYGQQ